MQWLRSVASWLSKRAARGSRLAFSDRYLLATNVAISGGLSAAGDWLEQRYEVYAGQLSGWERARTAHMAFSGLTVGVLCHHWYRLLDRRLPGRALATVLRKLLLDQLLFSPVSITLFFASVALFEELSAADFRQELRRKFWRLYAAEWVVWPPAQLLNFYLLPPRYRVLYDNTISLGYDIYTSRVKHFKGDPDAADPL